MQNLVSIDLMVDCFFQTLFPIDQQSTLTKRKEPRVLNLKSFFLTMLHYAATTSMNVGISLKLYLYTNNQTKSLQCSIRVTGTENRGDKLRRKDIANSSVIMLKKVHFPFKAI